MVWQKRGCCGIDLKKQTVGIGALFIVVFLATMIVGFTMIDNPEKFVNRRSLSLIAQTEHEVNVEVETASNSTTTNVEGGNKTKSNDQGTSKAIEKGEITTEERQLRQDMLRDLQNEGVQVVIGSLVTLLFTSMLIHGALKSKSVWFLPWLVQQTAELGIGIGMFLIYSVAGSHYSAPRIISTLAFFAIASYIVYAVFSHYVFLRKMKKHSNQVISSVMENEAYGASGVNYDRLQEEVAAKEMTPMPPIRERPENEANARRDDIMYFSL